jgi:hypothetical protein
MAGRLTRPTSQPQGGRLDWALSQFEFLPKSFERKIGFMGPSVVEAYDPKDRESAKPRGYY